MDFPPGLVTRFQEAKQILVLTGAGISAESGIPTFREAQTGLWSQYKPEDLASPLAFNQDPKKVWEWYAWRRKLISIAKPNAGHQALVAMQKHIPAFTLVTQNIDNLHQQAGSKDIIELHGNIFRARCLDENRVLLSWDNKSDMPPHCPQCGGILRPDVVWFGESLPHNLLQKAFSAAQTCNLVLVIGTSGLVQPAASIPLVALEHGAIFVEINPGRTPLSGDAHYCLTGPSGILLPALVAAAWADV